MLHKDPYKVLGLDQNATKDEVKKAYYSLAKKYHPDMQKDLVAKELAEEKMAEINEAYDMIQSGQTGNSNQQTHQDNPYTNYGNPWQQQQTWYDNRTYGNRQRPENQSSSCCNTLCCLCLMDNMMESLGGDCVPCC